MKKELTASVKRRKAELVRFYRWISEQNTCIDCPTGSDAEEVFKTIGVHLTTCNTQAKPQTVF